MGKVIYKVGDIVVYHNLPYRRVFCVKFVYPDSIVLHECWDEAGAKCFSEFAPFEDIRHATPEEVALGIKLFEGYSNG